MKTFADQIKEMHYAWAREHIERNLILDAAPTDFQIRSLGRIPYEAGADAMDSLWRAEVKVLVNALERNHKMWTDDSGFCCYECTRPCEALQAFKERTGL